MSIATYAAFKAKVENPWLNIAHTKLNFSAAAQLMYSGWLLANSAGAAPTSAVVPDRTNAGAIGDPPLFNSGGTMRVGRISASNSESMLWWLCDRLSHQGGLSGVTTGAQTTNLPTAALTRYTSGVGVMAGLEVYTAIGASSTTVTASYTDQAGNTGHTTEAVNWGNTGYREVNRLILLPLQSGDYGVRAVANVNAVATTGTAGNFGVTLFKPLLPIVTQRGMAPNVIFDGLLSQCGGCIPQVQSDACLFLVSSGGASGNGDTIFNIRVIED